MTTWASPAGQGTEPSPEPVEGTPRGLPTGTPPRFVFVGIGSLGDVMPHLALAAELQTHGHEAVVVGLAPYADTARALGVPYLAVPADTTALWPQDPLRRRIALAQPGLMYVAMLQRLRASAAVVNDALLATIAPGDVVVTGLVTAGAAALLARRRSARTVPVLFAPLLPTASAATSALAPPVGGSGAALLGSRVMWRLSQELSGAHTRDMAARLGEDADPRGPLGSGPVLLAASPAVTPPSPHWPGRVVQTGWIRPPHPHADGTLPSALDDFLTSHPDAVAMTFGTCPAVDALADVELFLAAGRRARRPVVLQTDAVPAGPLGDDAFNAPRVPHDALLPRVTAVVHHGGAGTTYATLAAGRPAVVIPHLGDQPYYARRVQALGAGPRGVPRLLLNAPLLARLVRSAVDGDAGAGRRSRAAAVGRRLAGENGRGTTVRHLLDLAAAAPDPTAAAPGRAQPSSGA